MRVIPFNFDDKGVSELLERLPEEFRSAFVLFAYKEKKHEGHFRVVSFLEKLINEFSPVIVQFRKNTENLFLHQ